MTSLASLEHVSCPHCGEDQTRFWAEENGYTAVKCTQCGFVYVNPRPPEDTIDEAAQTGIHETERGEVDAVSASGFKRAKVKMFIDRLQDLYPRERLKNVQSWLDVGAGFGELLAAVEELAEGSIATKGIEPCVPKAQVAQKQGIPVSACRLESVKNEYDVISFINVYSHLPQPEEFIVDLKTHLTLGGELFLVTGNGGDVSPEEYPDSLCLPDHLVFAGERHIRETLTRAGFQIVQVNRYKHFLPEPIPLRLAKNLVKKMLGRPTFAAWNRGPFRSLFIRAKRIR